MAVPLSNGAAHRPAHVLTGIPGRQFLPWTGRFGDCSGLDIPVSVPCSTCTLFDCPRACAQVLAQSKQFIATYLARTSAVLQATQAQPEAALTDAMSEPPASSNGSFGDDFVETPRS